jgi:hypothetical protein
MIIDRVTVTGADDSIEPERLLDIGAAFPWVEWGVLLSRRQEGSPRFPSLAWIEKLAAIDPGRRPRPVLSGHLCGGWVRDLARGEFTFAKERPAIANIFARVQLNFHAEPLLIDAKPMARALLDWDRREYIIQFDKVNDGVLASLASDGVRVVPLFDTSGGAGREPESWPSAEIFQYSGYAGGLHPDRLPAQLDRIATAAGEARIWIDVETHVRSDDDTKFDLNKVIRFLTAAQPFVTPAKS